LQDIETREDSATSPQKWHRVRKDFTDVVRRADINVHEMDYTQKKLQSQFSVLYNLMVQRDTRLNYEVAKASKRDSSAMKTISVVTLTFLPATFVSTVFSTTVFDFQNWDALDQSVASKGWWIYLLCCVLSTLVTFGFWYSWIRGAEKIGNKGTRKMRVWR
jgi:Mg2+ and Co2+ transporter CorA